MQIKVFNVPALGGESLNEEMNAFLRSKKVLLVENHFVNAGGGAYWSFCVKYAEDIAATEREREKIDYRKVLDEAIFKRFSELRVIRKRISVEENMPAYTIFHDDELAELAKLETITEAAMKAVKGIGDKKFEKYGKHFLTKPAADAQA